MQRELPFSAASKQVGGFAHTHGKAETEVLDVGWARANMQIDTLY